MSEEKKKPILVPPITDKLLAENEKNQKRWANLFVFQNPGVDDYTHRVISSNLEILEQLIKSRSRLGVDKNALLERIHALRDDTAIWLSSIGDFEKASNIAYTRSQKQLFKCYLKAVNNSDNEWCEHPKWQTEGGNISQNAYREFDFFSPKHGRKISMIRCNSCGFRNARDLDADLDKLSQHRAKARGASENLTKAQIENLPEDLRSINLGKILR